MTYREEQFMKQMTEIAIEVAELRAENKLLKSVNDSLIQALHKPVVVRGGDFENQFVRHVEKYFKYPDLTKTPNTPTEPLATEARVIIEECKKRGDYCGCVGECKLSYEDARKSSEEQP